MIREFQIELPKRHEINYDIRDYGAVAGGKISNTEAFEAAIKAASESGAG